MYASSIKSLITNNPTLLLPAKDDQAIDICIALSSLAIDASNRNDIKSWLGQMMERASFAYRVHGRYPCVLKSYGELLAHPKKSDSEYRESVTTGSLLYPMIALWAALLGDAETYDKVATMKRKELQHCNFQFWLPDDSSEEHFYTNSEAHGATLSDVAVEQSSDELLAQVFGECDRTPHFKDLSAVRFGWWPLIVVACRHYRLPLPLHLLEGLRKSPSGDLGSSAPSSPDRPLI